MSHYYNKDTLKESLEIEQVFELLEEFGAEPEYIDKGIVSQTICHNYPQEGSRKLYYYSNSKLFVCYSHCSSFDIFELVIKVMKIQKGLDYSLYDAMSYIASYFGFEGEEPTEEIKELEDWNVFKRHDYQIPQVLQIPVLKEYNPIILTRMTYPRIIGWEKEGIKPEVYRKNFVGYYPGGEQIVLPHFDINNRLIGIRTRTLCEEDAKRYGKYRPLKVNRVLYNHPLSMSLYNLNRVKDNLRKTKTAIIVESEKATMQYESYYGEENNIAVGCSGSNLSVYQVNLLRSLGVNRLIITFDKDYKAIGDETFQRMKSKMINIHNKYKSIMKVEIVFDKKNILPVHSSPLDQGVGVFEKLLNERILL